MRTEMLYQILGLTNTDESLISAIAEIGGKVETLSPKNIRELGTDYVNITNRGISLAFQARARFEMSRGTPRGAGPYVLSGIFYYPHGGEDLDPYVGCAPFSASPVSTRDEALLHYGTPDRTEEDEEEIDWDQWSKEARQLRTSYRSDLTISTISVSIPLLPSR
ncbi:hypothetical protein DES44_1244 [Roseateles depolymerans]|uniref:Uncharacterized protein n=2 Tax=Roseateles depolymerans TaxID=76731 RepID=A0A0U3MJG8_9BURK|nr:hypothetical protein RD2015_3217 [Roseateles depolymerans]REG22101.1 hypothetical protein DES44_1244 [Roseateles depolymerans]